VQFESLVMSIPHPPSLPPRHTSRKHSNVRANQDSLHQTHNDQASITAAPAFMLRASEHAHPRCAALGRNTNFETQVCAVLLSAQGRPCACSPVHTKGAHPVQPPTTTTIRQSEPQQQPTIGTAICLVATHDSPAKPVLHQVQNMLQTTNCKPTTPGQPQTVPPPWVSQLPGTHPPSTTTL
jgi:hypothetical protein